VKQDVGSVKSVLTNFRERVDEHQVIWVLLMVLI